MHSMIEAGTKAPVLTVSQLTNLIRDCLEDEFDSVFVVGEISNAKIYPSGHWYFSLKDQEATLPCVCFKNSAQSIKFKLEDGLMVVARGKLSVYPPRGAYQMIATSLEPVGIGEWQLAFEQLKKKLEEEGLTNPERKRPIPILPRKVGVVTSPAGAALRDILSALGRRNKTVSVLISPAKVQGEGSPEEIALAIKALEERDDIDVIIVARGGGSIEDLWSFNTEIVARAVANSRIPVVSGVGHETDITICDLVADLRAPTPTAAAELVARGERELLDKWHYLTQRLSSLVEDRLSLAERELHRLSPINALSRYEGRLELSLANVQRNRQKLDTAIDRLLSRQEHELIKLTERLRDLGPGNVLSRGFSILRGLTGNVVTDVGSLKSGDKVQAVFKRGRLNLTVDSIDEDTTYDQ
ncbi:MAG: exodeoxyribonuclease VII large subunit [Candidatus Obscuribacterales bacterium]|nr:exodeoxyribonuclease VII large subunit [Candidatus Obscuribacterales bacterium]